MAWILYDLFLAMPPVECERRLKRRLANAATTGLPCSIVSRRGKVTGLSIINSLASYRAETCPPRQGHPRQGYPRAHDPHRPAAGDHERRGRLGTRAVCHDPDTGFLVRGPASEDRNAGGGQRRTIRSPKTASPSRRSYCS